MTIGFKTKTQATSTGITLDEHTKITSTPHVTDSEKNTWNNKQSKMYYDDSLSGEGTLVSPLGTKMGQVTKEYTGFYQPENVIVTYNSANRTISLTGTVQAYYLGRLVTSITNTFISTPHSATLDKTYFLYYDGSFHWSETYPAFNTLHIAVVNYRSIEKFASRECHGFMQWETHRSEHINNGTFRISGGDISGIVLESIVASERRPDISDCVIIDEDLQTTNLALTSKSYTRRALSGNSIITYSFAQSDIVELSGNQPYYNSNVAGNYTKTLLPDNSVMTVWLFEVPVSADADSQRIRHVFVQGQSYTTATNSSAGALIVARDIEKGKSPSELNLGVPAVVASEYVCIHKFIIQYNNSNWSITDSVKITGTRTSQISAPSGSYLSLVETDATIDGNGTTLEPLSIQGSLDLVEKLENKSTDFSTINDTLYPSVKAVQDLFNTIEGVTELSTYVTTLTSDINFAGQSDYVDILTLSNLPAGKYLILSHVTFQRDATTLQNWRAKLVNGTEIIASGRQVEASASGAGGMITLHVVVYLTETSTIKLQVRPTTFDSSSYVRYLSGTATPEATKLTAIRIDNIFGTASGGVTDGDKGDITVSNNGLNWEINEGAVGMQELGVDVKAEFDDKQDVLVSGTDIKTINSESLLNSGDITLAKISSLTSVSLNSVYTAGAYKVNSGCTGLPTGTSSGMLLVVGNGNGEDGCLQIFTPIGSGQDKIYTRRLIVTDANPPTPPALSWEAWKDDVIPEYTLPIASETVLGGIKTNYENTGIIVDETGIIKLVNDRYGEVEFSYDLDNRLQLSLKQVAYNLVLDSDVNLSTDTEIFTLSGLPAGTYLVQAKVMFKKTTTTGQNGISFKIQYEDNSIVYEDSDAYGFLRNVANDLCSLTSMAIISINGVSPNDYVSVNAYYDGTDTVYASSLNKATQLILTKLQ